mmetsp:Transcript_11618/g.30387  ORF Transcript_11618/g.30387 Transcript_11618/m.30387 type:complete len:225 (-) Transcript_11618:1708-2382(-)
MPAGLLCTACGRMEEVVVIAVATQAAPSAAQPCSCAQCCCCCCCCSCCSDGLRDIRGEGVACCCWCCRVCSVLHMLSGGSCWGRCCCCCCWWGGSGGLLGELCARSGRCAWLGLGLTMDKPRGAPTVPCCCCCSLSRCACCWPLAAHLITSCTRGRSDAGAPRRMLFSSSWVPASLILAVTEGMTRSSRRNGIARSVRHTIRRCCVAHRWRASRGNTSASSRAM